MKEPVVMDEDEARQKGLVTLTDREVAALQFMTPEERRIFAGKKIREHGAEMGRRIREAIAGLEGLHPLGGFDKDDRRKERNRRKREKRR